MSTLRDHNHVFSEITGMSFDNLASVHTGGFRAGDVDPGERAGKLLSGARPETFDRALDRSGGCPGQRHWRLSPW